MRISSKKILALVLCVAMLMSCMVFSFSANAAVETLWYNHFDNGSDTNWMYNYANSTTDIAGAKTNVKGQYVADAGPDGAGDGVISLKVMNTTNAAGFRLYDERDTTGLSNNADTGTVTGKFKIKKNWHYAVDITYKAVSVTDPVNLWVSFAGSYNYQSDVSNGQLIGNGGVKRKVAVLDAATDWVTTTVYFPKDEVTAANGVVINVMTTNNTVTSAEVYVDDIVIRGTTSDDDTVSVDLVYNETVVQSYTALPGVTFSMEDNDIPMILPDGCTYAMYSDAAYTTRTTLSAYPDADTTVYLRVENAAGEPVTEGITYTGNDDYLQDYEGEVVAIDKKTNGTVAHIKGEKNHTLADGASGAVKLYGTNKAGNTRPQFDLTNKNGEVVLLKDNTYYEISFWIYNPSSLNTTTTTHLWIVAADADKTFSSSDNKSNYYFTVEKEYTSKDIAYDMWQKVTFTVTPDSINAYKANGTVGKPMRIGIAGNSSKYTYYIDDIVVKEIVDTTAWGNTWSFESETVGADLDSKGSDAKVSDKYARTGNQSLYVYNASTSGRTRTQVYLKNGKGNMVSIEHGKDYLVSFWAYVPKTSPADVQLNMWFAGGDGTAVRPNSGDGSIGLFYDDGATAVTALPSNGGWVQVTRYLENVPATGKGSVAVGEYLLMSLGDCKLAATEMYIDDVSVICLDDIALAKNHENYLFRTNLAAEGEEANYTNLHKYVGTPAKEGVYTSVRLGATYCAGDTSGSSIVIEADEYEIVERGILVGEANSTIDINNYKWQSSKSEELDTYWERDSIATTGQNDPVDVTYTLRLANMGEAWFNGEGNDTQNASYQYRAYYKVKVPCYKKATTSATPSQNVEFIIYGDVSDAFTFAEYAATFEKNFWFSDINS